MLKTVFVHFENNTTITAAWTSPQIKSLKNKPRLSDKRITLSIGKITIQWIALFFSSTLIRWIALSSLWTTRASWTITQCASGLQTFCRLLCKTTACMRYSTPKLASHWLVHGHFTSNNETVYGNVERAILPKLWRQTGNSSLLTTIVRDLREQLKVAWCFGCFQNLCPFGQVM